MNLADMTVSKKVLEDMLTYQADIKKAIEKHTQEGESIGAIINAIFLTGMAFQQVRNGGNTEILE